MIPPLFFRARLLVICNKTRTNISQNAYRLGALLLIVSALQACAPPREARPNCGFVFPYENTRINYVQAAAENAENLEFALWRRGYTAESMQVYASSDDPIINEHFVYLHYSLRSTKTCLVDFAQRVVRERVNVRMSSADEYRKGPVFYLVDTSVVVEESKENTAAAQ